MATIDHPVTEGSDPAAGTDEPDVMGLLQEHVPLALLWDITAPEPPESEEILAEEGLPADEWWKP